MGPITPLFIRLYWEKPMDILEPIIRTRLNDELKKETSPTFDFSFPIFNLYNKELDRLHAFTMDLIKTVPESLEFCDCNITPMLSGGSYMVLNFKQRVAKTTAAAVVVVVDETTQTKQ